MGSKFMYYLKMISLAVVALAAREAWSLLRSRADLARKPEVSGLSASHPDSRKNVAKYFVETVDEHAMLLTEINKNMSKLLAIAPNEDDPNYVLFSYDSGVPGLLMTFKVNVRTMRSECVGFRCGDGKSKFGLFKNSANAAPDSYDRGEVVPQHRSA